MAQHLLVWVGFVGWIIAGRRGSHIRITAILDRVRGPARVGAEVFIQSAVAVLGLVMLIKSPILIQRNLDVEWVSLPLSVALVYLPVPIAGAAVVIQSVVEIARVLSGG
jgi:TRAP-type C4-dicarboxylate transport system permease small subunit